MEHPYQVALVDIKVINIDHFFLLGRQGQTYEDKPWYYVVHMKTLAVQLLDKNKSV